MDRRRLLMKTGGRMVKHARYYGLLPAEGHLNRKLFGQMAGAVYGATCAGRGVAQEPFAFAGT